MPSPPIAGMRGRLAGARPRGSAGRRASPDGQPVGLGARDADGRVAGVVERARVGDDRAEVRPTLPPRIVWSSASSWLFGSRHFGAFSGIVGIARRSTRANARSYCSTKSDGCSGPSRRAARRSAAEVVAVHQVELQVRRELAAVGLLEPAEDRDQRARVVCLLERAAEVGVVHPLAALEIDRQDRERCLGVQRHGHLLTVAPAARTRGRRVMTASSTSRSPPSRRSPARAGRSEGP